MKSRTYSTIHSAKRALRKAGLSVMAVAFDIEPANSLGRYRVVPVIQCDSADDVAEVSRRGFNAVLKTGKAGSDA